MSAQHTAEQVVGAGVEISLRIGQHVRHRDYNGTRVTGVVRGLSVDSDRVLHADIVLDAPIVIEARGDDDHEIRIYHQHVPAHELAPFDEREDLIVSLLTAAMQAEGFIAGFEDDATQQGVRKLLSDLRAAIAKATGSAA